MNAIFSIFTAAIMTLTVSSAPYTSIEKAFKSNDSKELASLGKSKFLISVLGKESVYSQSQATLVLKNFFSQHPGSKFEYMFKGSDSSGDSFAIGNYTSKGQKFRVTIYFDKEGSSYKIESLRIEKN